MFRRIKWELGRLTNHIAVIGLGAFLCVMGGILLWVNGGSGWFVLQSFGGRGPHSLTIVFLIWLFAYALCGIRLAVRWAADGCTERERRRAFIGFLLTALAYLLDLVWYALFFCTRLTLFSLIVLLIAVLVNLAAAACSRREMFLPVLLDIAVVTVEIGFICYVIYFLLLN